MSFSIISDVFVRPSSASVLGGWTRMRVVAYVVQPADVTPFKTLLNSAVGRTVLELFVRCHVGCLSLMFPGLMLR